MPETRDRYIYQVEIDISDVDAEIERLRKRLGQALTVTGDARAVETVAKPAKEAAEQIERIAKIDTSKSTESMRDDLQAAVKEAARLEDRLQKLNFAGGFTGGKISNSVSEAYDRIERELGREAANAMRASGRVPSIGDLSAEFTSSKTESLSADDIRGAVGEATTQVMKEVREKTRRTGEEIAEEFALMGELYEVQIKQSQTNQELVRREIAEIEQAQGEIIAAGAGQDPALVADAVAGLDEAWEESQRELTRLTQEERELAASLTDLRQRQRRDLERAQQEAERIAAKSRGDIATAGGSVTAGPGTTYTQQTAITVRRTSVDNAKDLAAALKEAAAASKQMAEADSRGIGEERRKQELQLVRDRLKLEQESAGAASKIVEAEKRATAQRAEQEKRLTQAAKAESTRRIEQTKHENRLELESARQTTRRLAEEERRRTQQEASEQRRRASSQTAGVGGGLNTGALVRGGLAAVGVYSADQILRTFYEEGRTGAQLARTAETFEFLAERAGVSADEMLAAVSRASAGTIDDMTAINLSAQILAQRFATTTKDLTGDTETLVAASRRFAQIYTDEQGQFLTTQEVFSRLIKFIREGNKELVDQFGLSNQAIAQQLGITVDGLASAEGAALRYKGVVQILGQEVERLGKATAGQADQIEAAEARIANARARSQQALTPLTANIAEINAATLENVVATFGDLDDAITVVTRSADDVNSAFNRFAYGAEFVTEQQGRFQELAETMRDVAKAAKEAEEADSDQAEALAELAEALRVMGIEAASNLTVTDAMVRQLNAAELALQGATTAAYGYAAGLDAALVAAGGLRAGFGGALPSAPVYNPLRDKYGGQAPTDLWVDTIQTQAERDDNYYQMQVNRLDEQRRLDERNAQETQRAWEQAAKQAAAAFESELRGVSGLFGTSEVTAEDMKLAELGLYEDKPDEYLRRLRDEVKNGKDYEGVSIEDAAARLGVDASQSADQILALFEQAWADSSLFAGGENLDLINRDAVERELKRIEESKAGQQAILEYFGISTAQTGTAAVASAAGAAIMTELGAGGTGVQIGFGAEGQATDGAAVKTNAISGGILTVAAIEADADTVQAFLNTLAVTIANTGDQVSIGHTLRADILAGMRGVGLEEAGSPMVEFTKSLRAELDVGDSATEIVAQATGIGHQLQNYIGAGLLDHRMVV